MSLIAISTLESARRKFFLNSTENMCKNLESNVFGPQESEMSLTEMSLNSTENMCKNIISSSGSHKLARKSKKKIFHGLDVHIV